MRERYLDVTVSLVQATDGGGGEAKKSTEDASHGKSNVECESRSLGEMAGDQESPLTESPVLNCPYS